MSNTKQIFLAAFLLLVSFVAASSAAELTLSGADSRFMAINGEVELYLVASDENGKTLDNLQAGDFILRDSPEGEEPGNPLKITGFAAAGERSEGISFLILVDDSGSMYDDAEGREASSWEESRAALARKEVLRFLEDLGSSSNRAGLAVFGTHYRLQAAPRIDRASIIEYLGESPKPEPEEAYTELFSAISQSAEAMSTQRGRRIVILFSDGEHYPFYKEGPLPNEALEYLRKQAVTLYAVRFGANRDEQLAEIARATGGMVYDVDGEKGLAGLYSAIRERVESEYSITYRPRPTGAGTTTAYIEFSPDSGLGKASAEIDYPSGFLFRSPSTKKWALISLIAVPFALLLLFILYRLKAAEHVSAPSLEMLRSANGSGVTVALTSGKTVISPGVNGGATEILPEGQARTDGTTIVVEKGSDGKWRASSPEGVIVNNRKSESTVIENGDVIRAGDELIVFDEGV